MEVKGEQDLQTKDQCQGASSTQSVPALSSQSLPSVIDSTTATMTKLHGVHLKLKSDTNDCCITGLALISQTTLLAADNNNGSVKLFDASVGKTTSHLTLNGKPWDVTCLSRDQAAVTMPYARKVAKLHVPVSATADLALVSTVDVSGICRGISATNGKVFVSYDTPGKIEVFDATLSNVLSTITGTTEEPIKLPYYVLASHENGDDLVYVSDRGAITKWSMDGALVATYKDVNLEESTGLALTGDGRLLVGSGENYQVHLVSPEGSRLRTILSRNDKVKCPQALCYSDTDNVLYVSRYGTTLTPALKNKIKRFQLK